MIQKTLSQPSGSKEFSESSFPCSIVWQKEVSGANVLVAIFSERESHAVFLLNQQNIARLDVVNCISHGPPKEIGNEPANEENSNNEEELLADKKENPL